MSVGILLNHRGKNGLPSAYQEVSWIRSVSVPAHIDTGYTPNNNTRVVCRLSWLAFDNTYWGGFGAATSSTSNAFECYVYSSYVNWNFYSNSYGADSGRGYAGAILTVYNIDANKNVFKISDVLGTTLKTITATNGTFTAPYTMYLFGSHRASSGHGYVTFYGHVYIYDDDTLVREFVPCYRKSDSVIGMYDLVGKQFYTNGGSGTFQKGGDGTNLIAYESWKAVSVTRGTAVWENNGVTLTATSADCYTEYTSWTVNQRVPIRIGETLTLSWEEDTNKSGNVYIFPNGGTAGMVSVNNSSVKQCSYTATSGITYVTFRFGVATSGETIAYKNISITSDYNK